MNGRCACHILVVQWVEQFQLIFVLFCIPYNVHALYPVICLCKLGTSTHVRMHTHTCTHTRTCTPPPHTHMHTGESINEHTHLPVCLSCRRKMCGSHDHTDHRIPSPPLRLGHCTYNTSCSRDTASHKWRQLVQPLYSSPNRKDVLKG